MKWIQRCLKITLYFPIFYMVTIFAQANLAGEVDTEAFLNENFLLQETYRQVLCVSSDGSCPTDVTTAVPCLTSSCARAETNYPIASTFDTIQAAADNAQAGDLIIIMPGRYRGVEIEETGGEDNAYIHFLGWGDPGSIIVDSPARPDVRYLRHHFYFVAAHHYIIQNLAFENAENGAGIFFTGWFGGTGQFAHHFIVAGVYSHDNGVWGLHTTSTNYVLIQDSIFTNSSEEHGAYISGSGDRMVIRRNVFQNNVASGFQINADPQSAAEEIFYWLETATENTCGWDEEDVEAEGAATWDDINACYVSQGLPDLGEFYEDGVSEGIIVEQNIITGNGRAGGAGINLGSVRNSTIRNNLIYGNYAAGIACWDNAYSEEKGLSESNFGCRNVRIINNTIVDERGGRGALILVRDNRDMTVANNIIIRNRQDALEIGENSGRGLRSHHNFISAIDFYDSPNSIITDLDAASGSLIAPNVAEALLSFVNPNFNTWVNEGGLWPTLNPNRPDYHLVEGNNLTFIGDSSLSPVYDLEGVRRMGTEIGALVASTSLRSTSAVTAPVLETVQAPASEPTPFNIIITTIPTRAPALYVDDDNTTGIENGSLQNPFMTVQQAVDIAAEGDVIAVAAGTYRQNILVQGKTVLLYGGYAGGSSEAYASGAGGDFSQRDILNFQSHLQGDTQDSTVTLLEAGTTLIDGFRITDGSRSIVTQTYCCRGGGVFITGGAPTISNNLIENNDSRLAAEDQNAETRGGGIYADDGDVFILNNIIRNNISGRGAGIALGDTNYALISRNLVQNNIGTGDHGGGLFIAAVLAEISYNQVIGNEIGRELGYGWGGGILIVNPGNNAILSYNIITENYAPAGGAGVFIDEGAAAILQNELIYANQCADRGIGVYVDGGDGVGSTARIINSTIVNHDCPISTGGHAVFVEGDSTVTINNSILWGNGGDDIAFADTSRISTTYTLSEEAIAGEGNLSADPQFADYDSHDYHLRSLSGHWDSTANEGAGAWVIDTIHSPAIDAGDPSSPFDAEPVPNGNRINLGAYGNTPEASLSR